MIEKINFPAHQKHLLAMSGGVDSRVLFDLLLKKNVNFSVAHANFRLRGEDSEKDAQFVEALCSESGIECFVKCLDVKKFKSENNASTQMAARTLRYEWFDQLMIKNKFDALITAHHLDDSVETFLINLTRGTGLKGLCGIDSNPRIYRPLLNFTKEEISHYTQENNLTWREDSSNQKDDYLRNKIRHYVIPNLTKADDNFYNAFQKTITQLSGTNDLLENLIQKEKEKLLIPIENGFKIELGKLKNHQPLDTFLYYLLRSFGFHHPQELVKFLDANSGTEIQSETYRLIKNRSEWILSSKKSNSNPKYFIHSETTMLDQPFWWKINKTSIPSSNNLIVMDCEKLIFPLYLRNFDGGERFYPEGMNGKSKKLSKYFKDEKFSKLDKENTWLLCNGNDEIIWVVGRRKDVRFLPTNETKLWLEIQSLD